ncbi:FKBP-type peptidyl-prolyl cis-trans isomerase [Sphingomonas sp.]|jgi:FKBP-type peptidyl-prolyl cis-trans isomerase|uniref:FKBP-type peptidyl-prolyl cis-trans isomerase n=1 Tax=Sphingomonas sp. TaxID=28214 RepID=UPI002D804372|nr:FKBP-type peptidyl-prolyl cis-trans isomerase [Sphingomonas sp.]HEU0044514.1 FKBP-type peptidyl-prolyl cis-trans isomerase [Sphingomonas sp.]
MTTVTAVPLQPVKRGYLIWLWLGILLACVSAYALARQGDPALLREARGKGVVTTPSGLQYKVLKAGEKGGAHPTATDVALIQYHGRLMDGTTFDKSQQPTPLQVGGVVPGFAEALKLMTKGAKYRVWLPPALGYGAQATGPIPANSTLVFDIDLVDFRSEAEIRQMQQQQGMGGALPPGAIPPG